MSNPIKNNTDFYVVGGTLRADAPSYIERDADRELYEHILKGDFCCVLTPRQMGKSSLMIRTAERLKKQGQRTAIIDLTQIGTEKEKTSADKWYYGIAYRIVRELGIKIKLSDWWQEREKLPALQRLTEFFEDVLLPGTHEPIVIFVDEIDTTIALPFTDDFFAAIRACYNARAANPAYQRLNFVLLGVATPSDLIKDARRTPFNIGHGIQLSDFSLAEAKPLSLGLCPDPVQGEKMLARILYWTGGHPYLTQKLCGIVAHEKLAAHSDEVIDSLVEKNFLALGANRQESNLKFVSDRLLQDRKSSRKRLKLYRRVYREKPVLDDPLSPTHTSLKLSGLVLPRTGRMLSIRNRIYEKTFTGEWIREVIPTNWNRNIAVAIVAILLIGFFIWYTLILPSSYIVSIRVAQEYVPIRAYNKLKGMPFYKTTAENLFADYWHRRALRSERQENRDSALIYHLKALTIKELAVFRSAASQLIEDDYKNLMATYRQDSPILSVAFSPDGKTVLTVSLDGMAQLWDAATGKSVASPIIHGSRVSSVAFSPEGKTVLTGGSDGRARLWGAVTGKPVSPPIIHGSYIYSTAFSPDGKTVFTGSNDGRARLWDVATGKPVANSIIHEGWILSVAFSPDGKIVLTGGSDCTARLWHVATGELAVPPMIHEGWIASVAFSPDERTMLTVSLDDTVRLWDAVTGKPVPPPIKHGSRVYSAFFSPDGKAIVAVTSFWIHQSIIVGEITEPSANRLLPCRWADAYHSLDDKGKQMHVAVRDTSDSIKIIDLRFDRPDAPPIQGDPEELLKEWQKKLALKLNEETGKIEPMYPPGIPRPPVPGIIDPEPDVDGGRR